MFNVRAAVGHLRPCSAHHLMSRSHYRSKVPRQYHSFITLVSYVVHNRSYSVTPVSQGVYVFRLLDFLSRRLW